MAGMTVDSQGLTWTEQRSPTSLSLLGAKFSDFKLLEFVAAMFLIAQGFAVPGLPIAFPVAYLAMGILVAVAIMRRPQRPLTPLNGYVWTLAALLGYYALVSMTGVQSNGGGDWLRRMIRLVLLMVFIGSAASGRLHLPSLVKGYGAGLLVNAGLFYTGLAPQPYEGFLTGFTGDKNAAGLVYSVVGLLLLTMARSTRQRIVVIVVFGLLVFLTGSRTSMAGMAGGLLWLVVAGRLPMLLRWGVGAGLIWGLNFVEQNFARVGIFANREGTDWFREQIAQAVEVKVAATPAQGMGLGEAFVDIPQGRFFFHSSYDTLFVEGGYVALAVVLAVTLLVGLRLFRLGAATWQERVVEAATVCLLVCAWQLGEVFLTVSWGLLMATSMRLQLQRRSSHVNDGPDTYERGPAR